MELKQGKIDAVGYISSSTSQPDHGDIWIWKGKCTWWYLLEIKKMTQDPEGWSPGGGYKGAAPPCRRKFSIWWAQNSQFQALFTT